MALYRTTSDPNATCPEDLYSSDELERMDQASNLEEQIDALDRQLMDLDLNMKDADIAGDFNQLFALETRHEELIEVHIGLSLKLHNLNNID